MATMGDWTVDNRDTSGGDDVEGGYYSMMTGEISNTTMLMCAVLVIVVLIAIWWFWWRTPEPTKTEGLVGGYRPFLIMNRSEMRDPFTPNTGVPGNPPGSVQYVLDKQTCPNAYEGSVGDYLRGAMLVPEAPIDTTFTLKNEKMTDRELIKLAY